MLISRYKNEANDNMHVCVCVSVCMHIYACVAMYFLRMTFLLLFLCAFYPVHSCVNTHIFLLWDQ